MNDGDEGEIDKSLSRTLAHRLDGTAWDEDFIDEEEEGYFEFDDKGMASSTSATSTARWTAA